MESVFNQQRTFAAALCAVPDDAVIIHGRVVGIRAGLDAAVRGLHDFGNCLTESGGKRSIPFLVGQRVIYIHTADAVIAFGWGCTSGGIGVQREEKNGALLTGGAAPGLQFRIVADLLPRYIDLISAAEVRLSDSRRG